MKFSIEIKAGSHDKFELCLTFIASSAIITAGSTFRLFAWCFTSVSLVEINITVEWGCSILKWIRLSAAWTHLIFFSVKEEILSFNTPLFNECLWNTIIKTVTIKRKLEVVNTIWLFLNKSNVNLVSQSKLYNSISCIFCTFFIFTGDPNVWFDIISSAFKIL